MGRRARRRIWPIVIGVGALSVVLAFAATYFLFFQGDSVAPLALSTPTVAETEGGFEGSFAGEWRIAEGSEAGYRVREKLAWVAAQSDAVGRTSAITGSVTFEEGTDGSLTAMEASFEADVTQLQSDEARRDSRMRTMGLETDAYPTASFVLLDPITVPSGATDGEVVTFDAHGELTIHGGTKEVTIPAEAQLVGDTIEIVGSLTFLMADFGIDPPNVAGLVSVEDQATLEFKLVLVA